MGAFLLPLLAAVVFPQGPGAPGRRPDSGLVLVGCDEVTATSFGLGGGGVRTPADGLECAPGRCVTPGGVEVACRRQGVHLAFPDGRELLFAPDGYLHLRDGGVAGPFAGGVELRLGDGCAVRIDRGGSRRNPLTEVALRDGERMVRLWRRGGPAREQAAADPWLGDRLWCLGAGDALYRAVALGPLITLQRVLAPQGEPDLPAARLVLMAKPVRDSLLALLQAQSAHVRPALADVRDALLHGDEVFATDAAPPRLRTDSPRFALGGGFELQFELDGARLLMELGRAGQRHPFAQWQLGYGADVRCVSADEQPGTTMGRSVRLPLALPDLAARPERRELVDALAVLRAIGR